MSKSVSDPQERIAHEQARTGFTVALETEGITRTEHGSGRTTVFVGEDTAFTALRLAHEHDHCVARTNDLPGDRITLTFEPDSTEPLPDFEDFETTE